MTPMTLIRSPLLRGQTDERLVGLVRDGHDQAFEAIVLRYRRPLLRYCSRLMPAERAEDVVQHAFVQALESIRRSDAHIRLRPWLYRIAHNASLNALRDRGLRYEELDESYDGVERPDQAFERRLGLRDAVAAVQALPPRQRDAIVLRELEGRTYEQIAAALGVSGGAARQLLNRARRSLRASVTAVTPAPLLGGIGSEQGQPLAARIAELTAGASASAGIAKVAATVLVTGAVVGGVAEGPLPGTGDGESRASEQAGPARGESDPPDRSGRGHEETAVAAAVGGAEDGEDRSGPNRGHEDGEGDDDDSSGPGAGGDADDDRSGPGDGEAGDDGDGTGHSGSGDLVDSSGPGSGSGGSAVSGSSGSGSGFDGSGDGSSGSGSGSGGSSGSGTGSSGSGGVSGGSG